MQSVVGERYKILGELGQGGMGVVYTALDGELGVEYALKILPKELGADHIRLQRFRREVQLLAGMDHPNIVKAIRVGVEKDQPFLVMEKVDGRPLSAYCSKQAREMALASKLNVLSGIASGLAFIHKQNVVHRDLKPSNVLVIETTDGECIPKLIDFGLAMRAAESFDRNQRLTQTDVVVGSAPYVSPEQWLGKSADKRSDVYAFGCLAYELFTGKSWFLADSAVECMLLHFNSQPLMKFDGVPDALANNVGKLIKRCLAKDPSERYQDGTELLEDLHAIASGVSLKEAPSAPRAVAPRVFRPAMAKRTVQLLLGVIGLMVLAGGGMYAITEIQKQSAAAKGKAVADEFDKYWQIGHRTEGNKNVRLYDGYAKALDIYRKNPNMPDLAPVKVAEAMWESANLIAEFGTDILNRDPSAQDAARPYFLKAAAADEEWYNYLTKDHPEYLNDQNAGIESLETRREKTVLGCAIVAKLYENELHDWAGAERCYERAWQMLKQYGLPYDASLGARYMRCLAAEKKISEKNRLHADLASYLGVQKMMLEYQARNEVATTYWQSLQDFPIDDVIESKAPAKKGKDEHVKKTK